MTRETEIQHYYASIGRCPRCHGRNKLIGSEKMCAECRAKNRAYSDKYISSHPEYRVKKSQADKNRYNTLKRKGMCVVCGNKLRDRAFIKCETCRMKNRIAVKNCLLKKEAI